MEESKKASSTNTLRDVESDCDENDGNYDVDEESINMQPQLTDSLDIAMQEALRYAINPDEFQNVQKEITIQTRFAVIDWISRVADKLQYSRETLFNSVALLDHVLVKIAVTKKEIQLYTATCLWMSTKLYETKNRDLSIFVKVCHGEDEPLYQQDDFISTEQNIVQTLNGNIEFPTPETFVQALHIDMDLTDFITYSNFFLDVSLTSNEFAKYPPQFVAAAALVLGAAGSKRSFNIYKLMRLVYLDNPSIIFDISLQLCNFSSMAVNQSKGRNYAIYSQQVSIPLPEVVENATQYIKNYGS